MNYRNLLVLLAIMVLLTACGKSERIEGKVQDVFGYPLEGVALKIDKSTFTANTDDAGNYKLDYVPGTMKIIFSKDGYTTSSLDLNIQQKAHFPAESITLYPIPQEEGIFYIDIANNQIVKLESTGRLEEQKMQNKGFSMTTNYRYCVRHSEPVIAIQPGKAMFIDKLPYPISLTTVKEDGLIYEGNLNMFERHNKFSGFLEDSGSKVGEERLLLRTVELSPGPYSWVKMLKTDMIGSIPEKNGIAFGFKVTASHNNTSMSDFKNTPDIQQIKEGLVGFYQFNNSSKDSAGVSRGFNLENTEFANNNLFLNGKYQGEDGYTAIANINNFNYENFTVILDFNPIQIQIDKEERMINILCGGRSYRWFSIMAHPESNNLVIALNNGRFSHEFKDIKVEINKWNNVICSVNLNQKIIDVFFNKEKLPPITLPDDFTLTAADKNVSDKNFTFTNYGGGLTFHGYVDQLAIYNRNLSKAEISKLL